jgi:hypothetical protein
VYPNYHTGHFQIGSKKYLYANQMGGLSELDIRVLINRPPAIAKSGKQSRPRGNCITMQQNNHMQSKVERTRA